jgi:preprotein translocase subunit YajC
MDFAHWIVVTLLLADAEAGGDAAPGNGAAADGGGGLLPMLSNPLLPVIVIGIMLYFMILLPERKKRKELENQLGNLKKNDEVITSGGICGVVTNANPGSKYVTVKIDDSTKIRVLRSHIAHVGSHAEVEEKEIKEK